MALSGVKKRKPIKDKNLAEKASSSEESDAQDESVDGNEGWADSIAKVLNTTKPKTKKALVLSRAKKLKATVTTKTEKEEYGFEVAEAEIKQENVEDVKVKLIKEQDEKDVKLKNLKLQLRMKPSWSDLERERAFRKIATKGVVQLFNAVRIQQKDLQEQLNEAGVLDSKRDAVLNNIDKRKFLDVLMSGSRAKSENVDGQIKDEEDESSSSDEDEHVEESAGRKKKKWSVLDADFLTNKKVKHWDEEDDTDENGVPSEASDESDA